MSLEIFEFLVGVEQAFDLRIPDRDAVNLLTARHLINYIHGQLPQSQETWCLSQRAFYAIRHALADRLGVHRSALRPGTELLSVLPASNAQEVWAEVGDSLG